MVENKIPFPEPEPGVSDDERLWAMVCHLSCLFGGIIVPVAIHFLKGRSSKFIRFHARQAMVYQGAVLLGMLLTFGLVIFLMPLFVLMGVIWAFKARNGEWASYPVIRKFLS